MSRNLSVGPTSGDWRADTNGLWWKGDDGPYDDDYKKLPIAPEEILPLAVETARTCVRASLNTVADIGGTIFPRARTVSTRKYINDDFTEISIATKIYTRKVEELRARPEFSLLWQADYGDTGGWVLALGKAEILPDPTQGSDKAKIVFHVERLEIQDYKLKILSDGHDMWRPVILERKDGAWVKVQG